MPDDYRELYDKFGREINNTHHIILKEMGVEIDDLSTLKDISTRMKLLLITIRHLKADEFSQGSPAGWYFSQNGILQKVCSEPYVDGGRVKLKIIEPQYIVN